MTKNEGRSENMGFNGEMFEDFRKKIITKALLSSFIKEPFWITRAHF